MYLEFGNCKHHNVIFDCVDMVDGVDGVGTLGWIWCNCVDSATQLHCGVVRDVFVVPSQLPAWCVGVLATAPLICMVL